MGSFHPPLGTAIAADAFTSARTRGRRSAHPKIRWCLNFAPRGGPCGRPSRRSRKQSCAGGRPHGSPEIRTPHGDSEIFLQVTCFLEHSGFVRSRLPIDGPKGTTRRPCTGAKVDSRLSTSDGTSASVRTFERLRVRSHPRKGGIRPSRYPGSAPRFCETGKYHLCK